MAGSIAVDVTVTSVTGAPSISHHAATTTAISATAAPHPIITVEKLVMAVDSGVIVNPATASGQIEGGMTQALGYAVCEEMLYDARGDSVVRQLGDYKIFASDEMPELQTIFVETFEPSHPFGLKAVAEIPLDGVAPAVANAVYDAVGIWMNEIPMTPERVWQALKKQ